MLYCALIGYIHYEAPVEEQNFSTLIEFINAMEVREDDEEFKNPVDLMFDALESEKPNENCVPDNDITLEDAYIYLTNNRE